MKKKNRIQAELKVLGFISFLFWLIRVETRSLSMVKVFSIWVKDYQILTQFIEDFLHVFDVHVREIWSIIRQLFYFLLTRTPSHKRNVSTDGNAFVKDRFYVWSLPCKLSEMSDKKLVQSGGNCSIQNCCSYTAWLKSPCAVTAIQQKTRHDWMRRPPKTHSHDILC